jgi:glycosyltransferase involved in cell wall biosynthesis
MSARAFLPRQLAYLKSQEWDVHLACADDGLVESFAASEGATLHPVRIVRDPAPGADLRSLVQLTSLLRRLLPRAVVMGTPKMGLLGIIAAFVTVVPTRIYVLHGLRADGSSGWRHAVLVAAERLCCRLATHVVAVSPSLRRRAIDLRLAPEPKVHVIGHGSANGIDAGRFGISDEDRRSAAWNILGIPPGGPTVLVLGRITRDKGLLDLPQIWLQVSTRVPGARLLLVGPEELSTPAEEEALALLRESKDVLVLPFAEDVPSVFEVSDALLLPSKREGLPTVAIEAALSGVPTFAYASTGTVDAVVQGVTGQLVSGGDASSLGQAIAQFLLHEPSRFDRVVMRREAHDRFDREKFLPKWAAFLESAISEQRSSHLGSHIRSA